MNFVSRHRQSRSGAGATWLRCDPINSASVEYLWEMTPSGMAPGYFGDVYKCRARILNANNNSTELLVAVKKLRPALIPQYEQQNEQQKSVLRMKQRLLREVNMLRGLNHPNIAPLLGYQSGDTLFDQVMVTPWYNNGSLVRWISGPNRPLGNKYSLVQGISAGVKYLHDRKLVHGDLKPDNILISDNYSPIIIDFGLTSTAREGHDMKVLDSRPESNRGGNRAWLSPGRVNGEHIKLTDDLYALGCLILFILTGQHPYQHAKSESDFWRMRTIGMPPSTLQVLEGLDPPLPSPDAWWVVMNQCWSLDSAESPKSTPVDATMSNIHPQIIRAIANEPLSSNDVNSHPVSPISEEGSPPPSPYTPPVPIVETPTSGPSISPPPPQVATIQERPESPTHLPSPPSSGNPISPSSPYGGNQRPKVETGSWIRFPWKRRHRSTAVPSDYSVDKSSSTDEEGRPPAEAIPPTNREGRNESGRSFDARVSLKRGSQKPGVFRGMLRYLRFGLF